MGFYLDQKQTYLHSLYQKMPTYYAKPYASKGVKQPNGTKITSNNKGDKS